MEITRTAGAAQLELKLKGRLDAIWSDHVARALDESIRSGQHAIAVDMADVDYISSAGIRILVLYTRQFKAIQGEFVVINASLPVRQVLQMAGLTALLQTAGVPALATAPPVTQRAVSLTLAQGGALAEVYDLDPQGVMTVEWPGEPTAWLNGSSSPGACRTVEFPPSVMGLGLGELAASSAADSPRLGEFLGAAGAAVCQPADGSQHPDYLLLQGELTPRVNIAYGMLGRGNFRHLLRFDKGPDAASLPLSMVLRACLDVVGSDAVGVVLVAETAALIGAALQQTPTSTRNIHLSFPEVRNWLSFTAEAAFTNSTSLLVGFAAQAARAGSLRLLRPLIPTGELHGHLHAAAFPYRPLRKGLIDLGDTVQPLFESARVLGLLHLLHDWRPASGAGESRFLRGACWCAPLTI